MADDATDLTIYRTDRNANILRVSRTSEGVTLTATGGGNISLSEFDQIQTFVAGHTGAETFLAKLQARMAR